MFGRKKRQGGDFFKRSSEDRRVFEDEQPWFLTEDEAPDLDIDAGRSARMDLPEADPGH